MVDTKRLSPDRIRLEMRRRGLRQADIAAAIGCNQGQVSRLLSGESSPGSKTYRQICDYIFRDESSEREAGEYLLEEALNSCWDGTRQNAEAIAGVLRALAAFHLRDRG